MTTTKKIISTCLIVDTVALLADLAVFNKPLVDKLVDGAKKGASRVVTIAKVLIKKKQNG